MVKLICGEAQTLLILCCSSDDIGMFTLRGHMVTQLNHLANVSGKYDIFLNP